MGGEGGGGGVMSQSVHQFKDDLLCPRLPGRDWSYHTQHGFCALQIFFCFFCVRLGAVRSQRWSNGALRSPRPTRKGVCYDSTRITYCTCVQYVSVGGADAAACALEARGVRDALVAELTIAFIRLEYESTDSMKSVSRGIEVLSQMEVVRVRVTIALGSPLPFVRAHVM